MNEFVINVIPDPSTIININNSDGAVSLDIGQNQQNSLTIEDDVNNVLLNPSVFYNGINIVYLSGVSGELLHNTFGDLQGGVANQYYHLSSGQYFNLTTGSVIRPSETGAFYPRSNPSGYITGVDLSGYVTGDVVRPSQTGAFYPASNPSGFITGVDLSAYVTGSVVRPSDTGNFITTAQTGAFYPIGNPSGYITGLDLSNYSTISFSTGISGHLQNQVTDLNNQTGSYYLISNPSGYITGVDLSGYVTGDVIRPSDTGAFYPVTNPSGYITGINNIVYTTGNQDISGLKDFQTRPTVLDVPVLISGDAVDTIHLYGKNDQGTTIYKGQPVYINGANGANPLIQLASNTGERTSSKTIGLLYQDLSVNQFGYIITEGLLEGFNTSAGVAGDPMWLGPSGSIIYGTGNKPYGNDHLVSLGIVLRSSNNNGKVYVKVQNGFEIEELHKVYAINRSDKDTLLYNSASGAWFARQINTGDVSGISNYYLGSNPSGYITGISNLVYTTGDQNITGVKTFLSDVGVGVTSPSARLHTISTTEQLRLGFDASNYASTTVSSAGLVTLNAIGASAGFAFSNTTRPTSAGTGTPSADSLITFADALTQLDSVIGWNLIPFNGSTQNTINFGGSNSLSLGAVHVQITAGGTGVTASAGYVFGSANGQGILPYRGSESSIFWSKRLKVRLGISFAVFEGDAVGWFWLGCDTTSPPAGNAPPTTLRGYGLRFDQSGGIVRITPVTHDGTNYIYGTPVTHTNTIYTMDMYLGTMNVYNAADTLVATVSGGRFADSSTNRQIQLHCQTTLNNGVGNNYFRLRVNQMQFKFLES